MEALGRPLAGLRGPFKGLSKVRVLDFTKLLPGPFATQLLADLGCRVTKVELPHFPDGARRWPLYAHVNRGKKELSLDFRTPKGLAKARALVKGADVLVEGFRPGLMDRVGLGWAQARRLNPRLIYCSLVGWPAEGPWARKAGHDLNFLSVSGLLGLHGGAAPPPSQLADLSGSLGAACGILAALLERGATGRGRRLTVAMSEAIHSLLPVPLSELAAEGRAPAPPRWWDGSHPFYRLYAAADGRRLAVAALERPFALALLSALGRDDLAPLADAPLENRERLRSELEKVFAGAPAAAWLERLEDKDVCVTPVLPLDEAAAFQRRLRDGTKSSSPRRRKRPSPANNDNLE